MAAGFQLCSINKTLRVTFMCLTSCWSARMTEPLQMAAKIKLRMLAVWHVQVEKNKNCTLSFFSIWCLVLCGAAFGFGVLKWGYFVLWYYTLIHIGCTAHVPKCSHGAVLLHWLTELIRTVSCTLTTHFEWDILGSSQTTVAAARMCPHYVVDAWWVLIDFDYPQTQRWHTGLVWTSRSPTPTNPLCLLLSSLCSSLVQLLSVWCISPSWASLWRSAPI